MASIGKRAAGFLGVSWEAGGSVPWGTSLLRKICFLIAWFSVLELVIVSKRGGGKPIGNLMAGALVVIGLPDWIDGMEVEVPEVEKNVVPAKHALDD
ncbi:MAG: hypothetical protein ACI87E_001949 [Mariniblastus sp.]